MREKRDELKLTQEQKKTAIDKLQNYVEEHFETEIGRLQAEIFLDYITKNIGNYYYNKGIADSLAYIADKADDMYLLMKDES